MTSWCVVCDVRFLDPMSIREGESAVDFAARVQERVAHSAGIKAVPYDGYLKYWKPSERFIQVPCLTSAWNAVPLLSCFPVIALRLFSWLAAFA